jgi:hypothetical protein
VESEPRYEVRSKRPGLKRLPTDVEVALERSDPPTERALCQNGTAGVDVVLVLLIIFMIIAPVMMQGYDVGIPGETVSTARCVSTTTM